MDGVVEVEDLVGSHPLPYGGEANCGIPKLIGSAGAVSGGEEEVEGGSGGNRGGRGVGGL